MFRRTQEISSYRIVDSPAIDLALSGDDTKIGEMVVPSSIRCRTTQNCSSPCSISSVSPPACASEFKMR